MEDTDTGGLPPYHTESRMFFDFPECPPTYSGVALDPDIPGADEDDQTEAYF